jgi:hypothetical protein
MSIPNVKNLVSGNKRVKFLRYQDENLWYECEGGFSFPVPISDASGAIFLPEDKALVFMRWIRKHIQYLSEAANDCPAARE